MIILGIESSCDETAAAVVADGRVVHSSVIHSQVADHALYGGVVPEIASRRHTEVISDVVQGALAEANLPLSEIDCIAVTAYPGLIGALLVGVGFAKGLGFAAGKPLVPVHHIRGHVAANFLAHPALEPPFLALIASGGHSHIVAVEDYTTYKIIGQTRDDAAGEAFDKVARVLGLGYPGGPAIDRVAQSGDASAFSLPLPKVSGSAYDFSFSGLKTAVINLVHNAEQKGLEVPVADVAASFQRAAVALLCGHTLAAAKDFGMDTLVLAGGVAANSLLRERLTALCHQNGIRFFMPPLPLCADNAAMIAAQGYFEAMHLIEVCGEIPPQLDLNAAAVHPIDR